jgi:hypothetical protein
MCGASRNLLGCLAKKRVTRQQQSHVLGSLLMLSASLLPIGTYAQSRATNSEVVRDCDDTSGCVPDSTSLVVVYVYDAAGGPIAGMTVSVAREGIEPSASPVTAQTDRDGMAAVSLEPGNSYSVRITGPGWPAFMVQSKLITKGGTRLLHVVMRLPPIH